jgi:hypothetical protein
MKFVKAIPCIGKMETIARSWFNQCRKKVPFAKGRAGDCPPVTASSSGVTSQRVFAHGHFGVETAQFTACKSYVSRRVGIKHDARLRQRSSHVETMERALPKAR